MAGELCGAACGFCGRCDDDRPVVCSHCGQDGCEGDCPEYYDAMDAWANEQERVNAARDREVA